VLWEHLELDAGEIQIVVRNNDTLALVAARIMSGFLPRLAANPNV
jgi:hypothetical protein